MEIHVSNNIFAEIFNENSQTFQKCLPIDLINKISKFVSLLKGTNRENWQDTITLNTNTIGN